MSTIMNIMNGIMNHAISKKNFSSQQNQLEKFMSSHKPDCVVYQRYSKRCFIMHRVLQFHNDDENICVEVTLFTSFPTNE